MSAEPATSLVVPGSEYQQGSVSNLSSPCDSAAELKLGDFETADPAMQINMIKSFTFNRSSATAAGANLALGPKSDIESSSGDVLMPSSPACRRRSVVEEKPSEFRLATPQSPLYQRRKSSLLKAGNISTPSSPASPFGQSLLYVSSSTLTPLSTRKVTSYHPDDSDMGVCPSPLIQMEDSKPKAADDVAGFRKNSFLLSSSQQLRQTLQFKRTASQDKMMTSA